MKLLKIIIYENVFAIIVLLILSIALFVFRGNTEITTTIITAIVGALASIITFFFTKHNPNKKE